MQQWSRGTRIAVIATVATACVALDQLTKQLAIQSLKDREPRLFLDGLVRLVYAENPGAWGGLGDGWPWLLRTLVLSALPVLVLMLFGAAVVRSETVKRAEVYAYALLCGGGVGNIIDRLQHGYVVDFMYVGAGRLATNIFNVADVAIMLGAAVLIIARVRSAKPDGPVS